MRNFLEYLAIELLIRILHFCNDFRSILRFSMTSWKHFHLVCDSASLQLRIELDVNNMDIVDKNFDCVSVLKNLRRYQSAQINLKPVRILHKFIPARGFYREARPHEGSIYMPIDSDSGQWQRITLDGLESRLTMACDAPHFQPYALDPSQDLAVMVPKQSGHSTPSWRDVEIHLCSIKSGRAHPLALYSKFKVTPRSDVGVSWRLFIFDDACILKNRLVVRLDYFSDSSVQVLSDIVTWDWTTGTLLHRISLPVEHCRHTFLDESHLAVHSIIIPRYRTPDDGPSTLLSIYPLSTSSPASNCTGPNFRLQFASTLSPLIEFAFPELLEGVSLYSHSHKICSTTIQRSLLPGFVYSLAVTLCLSITLVGESEWRRFDIYVSGSKLRGHLDLGKSGIIPWEEWGEDATRWLEDYGNLPHEFWTPPGPRYFEIGRAKTRSSAGSIVTIDFHELPFRRYLCRASVYGNKYRVLRMADQTKVIDKDNPSIVDGFFKHPVVSRLPYMITTKGWNEKQWGTWVVDGEHLIKMNPWKYRKAVASSDDMVTIRRRVVAILVALIIFVPVALYYRYQIQNTISYASRPLWDKPEGPANIIPHFHALGLEPSPAICKLHETEPREQDRQVWDAVLFSTELDLLEVRLNELDGVVDRFFVVESDRTFTGIPKKPVLQDALLSPQFARFRPKITYQLHPGRVPNKGESPFNVEREHRLAMTKLINSAISLPLTAAPLVIMSDVDEIPAAHTIALVKKFSSGQVGGGVGERRWKNGVLRVNTCIRIQRPGVITFYGMQGGIVEFVTKMRGYSHADRIGGDMSLLDPKRIQETICSGRDIFNMLPEAYTYKEMFELMHPEP
ncbi:glycosyltransferase family 17 protein [Rhizoctonia solani]|uniref:Glycosyltransferase family 17 protein n=1 Tax=Rhizoctonia solani TaxID=456999 RepID=A0A8H8P063_9AGAM|nr:glycosyltransferase family 17 protein [Rhizoctonia solani]QRW22128.1 glycosyltransferase family 17 protein [Rhizoctonia solani]